jgi:DNA-binding transcriptional ArsR family regulator
MNVSVWQDVVVTEQPTRTVEDVDTLKALADPTRMAILHALMRPGELRVLSVKELAAELGEPQTKLYRHVRQLEAAGLIKVAATRLVSGIVEQRYQASQRDVRLSVGVVREHADEAEAAVRTVLDRFLEGMIAAPEGTAVLVSSEVTLAPDKADELRRRLKELNDWVDQAAAEPGDVPVRLLMGLYRSDVR